MIHVRSAHKRVLFSLLPFFLVVLLACNNKGETEKDDPHAQLQKPENTFTSQYLDGTPFRSEDFVGKKLLFAFFSYKNRKAAPYLKMIETLKEFEVSHQFRIFAVSIDYGENDKVREFVKNNGITLPVLIEDSDLDLAMAFKVQSEIWIAGVDNKHVQYVGRQTDNFVGSADGEKALLSGLKEALSIRTPAKGAKPYLGIYPEAPDFTVATLNGTNVKLSAYRGKVVLLLFFLPTCGHCHEEIKYLRDSFYPEMKKEGFEIIALSQAPLTDPKMRKLTDDLKMPWPVGDDSSREIRSAYSSEIGVPENFFIDKQGRVRFASTGFDVHRHANLYVMRVRHLLGIENPPLLSDKKFNGVESCMICHEAEYVSWQVTPHAHAMETLEIKGEQNNAECIGCHSLGMNDPKGYKEFTHPKTGEKRWIVPEELANVQCEHCHGVGGIHKSQPFTQAELQTKCLECHTEKFSLHFDFKERVQKVNHGDAAKILQMSEEERLALLKKVSKTPSQLFGTTAQYVGSDSCLSCHKAEHDNWKKSLHATTTKDWRSEAAKKQMPMKQGFAGADCESCHGPGSVHVQTKLKKDIRGLGDDCPFCVIEQICMSCHTPQNDPNFNLVKGLEKIRGHK